MMRDPLMSGIPLILETPAPEKALELSDLAIWAREIKLLYEIQGIGDDEWVVKEGEIERRWREVRDLLNPPKPPKEKKVKEKEKGGGEVKAKAKKGKKTEEEEEEEEEESGESRDEE
jgi:AP endonuclease-1